MSTRTDCRPDIRPALLALLVVVLTGCASQDLVRGFGRQAARGAVEGVGDALPTIQEPLRQTLRRALVEDDTLRQAAKDMAETTVRSIEVGLASPEIRRQIDDLLTQSMESLSKNGSEALRRLIRESEPEVKESLRRLVLAAEPELKAVLQRAATESIDRLTARLRDRIEADVIPATERLAKRTGEQFIVSLVAGLEGPLQQRLLVAGEEMSKALIRGAGQGMDDPTNQERFGGLTQLITLQAVRGARQGLNESLPDQRQVALIASIVVLAALLVLSATGLSFLWWRYHQSAKTLTIIAENINEHDAEPLKAAIQKDAHDNYVGPWLSSFLKRRGL